MVRRLYAGSDEVVKRYVGSDLVHVVDWEERTRMVTLPYSTYYYNDPNRFIDEEVVTQAGVNGSQVYVWTVEKVNNVETGRNTPESLRTFTPPIRREIARGTKERNILSTVASGRSNWAGQPVYYFPWITKPDPNKQYRITRRGPASENNIYAYESSGRLGVSYAGTLTDGSSKIVSGSYFTTLNGVFNNVLGLSMGLTYSQNPGYTLTVSEV